jgi:outer membrane immunogenic protein
MKALIFGIAAAAAAFSSPSIAADLPVPIEPVVAPVSAFTWTGFYVGANLGWACCGDDRVGLFDGGGFVDDFTTLEGDGVFGGVQAGYNFQWNWLVLGVEGDWQYSGYFDDEDGLTAGPYTGSASTDSNWFGTIRGRAGLAWERVLVYGTGGFAVGNTEYTVRVGSGPTTGVIREDEEFNTGWAAGAGVEVAFTDNLSAKGEWQFIDLGTDSASGAGFRTHPTHEFHTFRVGLNYRFSGLFQ